MRRQISGNASRLSQRRVQVPVRRHVPRRRAPRSTTGVPARVTGPDVAPAGGHERQSNRSTIATEMKRDRAA
jgi:hypothetical protein